MPRHADPAKKIESEVRRVWAEFRGIRAEVRRYLKVQRRGAELEAVKEHEKWSVDLGIRSLIETGDDHGLQDKFFAAHEKADFLAKRVLEEGHALGSTQEIFRHLTLEFAPALPEHFFLRRRRQGKARSPEPWVECLPEIIRMTAGVSPRTYTFRVRKELAGRGFVVSDREIERALGEVRGLARLVESHIPLCERAAEEVRGSGPIPGFSPLPFFEEAPPRVKMSLSSPVMAAVADEAYFGLTVIKRIDVSHGMKWAAIELAVRSHYDSQPSHGVNIESVGELQ